MEIFEQSGILNTDLICKMGFPQIIYIYNVHVPTTISIIKSVVLEELFNVSDSISIS